MLQLSSSSNYILSGTNRNGNISYSDPNLTFTVEKTINFVENATYHPFYLKSKAVAGDTISDIPNN